MILIAQGQSVIGQGPEGRGQGRQRQEAVNSSGGLVCLQASTDTIPRF